MTYYRLIPRAWYHEYKDHVRFHDYFNVMINNFPIITFRRIDFGLHDPVLTQIYMIGFLGMCYNWSIERR